jgi:hypothetical protein
LTRGSGCTAVACSAFWQPHRQAACHRGQRGRSRCFSR